MEAALEARQVARRYLAGGPWLLVVEMDAVADEDVVVDERMDEDFDDVVVEHVGYAAVEGLDAGSVVVEVAVVRPVWFAAVWVWTVAGPVAVEFEARRDPANPIFRATP